MENNTVWIDNGKGFVSNIHFTLNGMLEYEVQECADNAIHFVLQEAKMVRTMLIINNPGEKFELVHFDPNTQHLEPIK